MSVLTTDLKTRHWLIAPRAAQRMLARLQRAIDIHRRRRLLRSLPDYLLKDVGLSRSDIDYIAEALADGRQDPTRRPRG